MGEGLEGNRSGSKIGTPGRKEKKVEHVPVAGDRVDEDFAHFINKIGLPFKVYRNSASSYKFGTKSITAKFVNGKLVIRVGGGYMYVEDFIKQYKKIEIMKMARMAKAKADAQGLLPQNDGENVDPNVN